MIEEPIKYIQKVEIQGLFGRYDIQWNLHPDVNVLAGINGSGKSTILNFLCWKMLSDEEMPTEPFSNRVCSIKIIFNNEKYIVWFKNPDEKLSDFSSIIPYALRKSLEINLISTFDTDLNLYEANIKKRSDEQVKTELDLRLFDLQKSYLNYQVNLSKKLRDNQEISAFGFFNRFLEMIDSLFLESGKKVNRDKNEVEFLLDGKEINAYELSSGEKQLLIILLTVLVQDNKPAILLMDEPEISLHIEWQRKLIKYIRELNPNAQIIIATHSPDIIMKGWMDKVFNIEDIILRTT